ncbi:MAG: OsmC family peroxiredoxin [Ignavibacteriales bacterium]|nr:MAG: OsmC family peroxiredoxin [Ignavibacteriales bacterium]
MDNHTYNLDLKWSEGRIGEFTSSEVPSLTVATPPQFPKGVPDIWSPEHLLLGAVSSCLMTTFLSIAENSNLQFTSFDCKAEGKVEKIEGKFMLSEITLKPEVVIKQEKDKERTFRIVEKAENACLISNSVKSKINLETEVKVENTGE